MKNIYYLLIFIFISGYSTAQQIVPAFGKIDLEDLKLTSCSFEPDAHAMKLFDVQEIEFEPFEYSTRLTTERRVRIKIFNEKGYKHASIRIPYFSKKRTTKFKELKGIVYSLDTNDKIVIQKLDKKDFFKGKTEENIGIINFTFPNLKPGSVVEFSYTKVEKNILDIDPWIAQDEIPTAYVAATIITPTYSRIKEKVFGTENINQNNELLTKGNYNKLKREYFVENIRSFETEPFMSSYKDNLLRMIFLLIPRSSFFIDAMTTPESLWKYLGNLLLESPHWGMQISKTIPGTEALIDSAKKIYPVSERIGFIYEAVRKRIPDVGEQRLFPEENLSEVWQSRAANTAEINLILLNLLQKSNVECYPLLISTRENGIVSTAFPTAGQLNGVDVLAIDSSAYYLMDASLKYQSFRNPPFNVLNRQGFLLDKKNMRWVSISDERSLIKQTINIISLFNEEGILEGSAFCNYYNYARSYLLDSTTDTDDDDDRFFDKKYPGVTIKSAQLDSTNSNDTIVAQKIEFIYEAQQTDDFYFINPLFLSLKKENPFTKATRSSDIDFGCNQEMVLSFQMSIPTMYQIDHLPKNIIVRAPDTSFFYKKRVYTDSTQIYLTQTFEIKRSLFDKEEYPGIKEFFDRVFALMTEEIVLKKKK